MANKPLGACAVTLVFSPAGTVVVLLPTRLTFLGNFENTIRIPQNLLHLTSAMTDSTVPTIMKAAVLHKNGDPITTEVLSVVDDVPVPLPSEGELLVQVRAAALNPVDWKLMTGDFPGQKKGSCGADVAGVVVDANNCASFAVGDEIYADAIDTKGSFAEYVLVKASVACKKPRNLSMQEAASLPLAALTALQGLQVHGGLQEGQKVLIFGGSGGVGSLAIQMAKALGAGEVYATGSSDVNLIKEMGADVVVNYKEESLMESLRDKEFDLVFDTIGGLEHWQVGQAALKKTGVYLTIVGDGGGLATTMGKYVWRSLKAGLSFGHTYKIFLTNTKYKDVGNDMANITQLVEDGKVKPLLDEGRFDLTTQGVHDMIKVSRTHRAKGKLILEVRR